jgi:hypothetical protein
VGLEMNEEELKTLGEQAAILIAERYEERLYFSETVRVGFSHHKDARRVELYIADHESGRLLELFADIPNLDDEEAVHLGLDFLDGVLDEHLSSDREAMPRMDPARYVFEGHDIYLSGKYSRPDLEAEADAILAKAGFVDE